MAVAHHSRPGITPRDLTNRRFGRLVALELDRTTSPAVWICQCDCGQSKRTIAKRLLNGQTQSCGCLHREQLASRSFRHGSAVRGSITPEYRTWSHMLDRCFNARNKDYRHYGGRGITVCDEWTGPTGFATFLRHIGFRPAPRHTIERINNSEGYFPGNVRWALNIEQPRNSRQNVWLTYRHRTLLMSDWSRELGIPLSTICCRLTQHPEWPIERILTPARLPHP